MGGYTLLETLIAFVVLVVFGVLAYSLAFRNPASVSALKSNSSEQRGIPEVKPPGSAESKDAPASQSQGGSSAGR
jgi:hypothetical protein